jgi:hypothetical protein
LTEPGIDSCWVDVSKQQKESTYLGHHTLHSEDLDDTHIAVVPEVRSGDHGRTLLRYGKDSHRQHAVCVVCKVEDQRGLNGRERGMKREECEGCRNFPSGALCYVSFLHDLDCVLDIIRDFSLMKVQSVRSTTSSETLPKNKSFVCAQPRA